MTEERIGGHVDAMATLAEEKMRNRIWFTGDRVMDLVGLFKKADHILLLTIRSFEPTFYRAHGRLDPPSDENSVAAPYDASIFDDD